MYDNNFCKNNQSINRTPALPHVKLNNVKSPSPSVRTPNLCMPVIAIAACRLFYSIRIQESS